MNDNDFYTLRGYNRMLRPEISYAMEDYLEMICRHIRLGEYVRVNMLASLLNVTPPSASKMVVKLKESGMVEFEPYGVIRLTKQGEEVGAYLLYRHDVLNSFFRMVNKSENELELIEKIEHYVDKRTIVNMQRFLLEHGEG